MTDVRTIKKIDIHAHAALFADYIPPFYSIEGKFVSPDEVIEVYDRINVETGVLLPISDPVAQTFIMSSEACKYISDNSKGRFAWFCNVSPHTLTNTDDSDLGFLIEHYKGIGAKGVGEITTQLYADDIRMDNLFGHCERLGMPVTIHMAPDFGNTYGIVDDIHLPRLEKMLKKHPNLKILGHSMTFWSEISADITEEKRNLYPSGKVSEGTLAKLMREYENLLCDLSAGSGANAMMRDRDYAARFLEEFADRIYYGVDLCTCTSDFQFKFSDFLINMVCDGYLSSENYIKIVRGNAEKLLSKAHE